MYTRQKSLAHLLKSKFKLNSKQLSDCLEKFEVLKNSRTIDIFPHEVSHDEMAQLVMPINFAFKLTKKEGYHERRYMGTSDGVICGMALQLVQRIGKNSVILLTNDKRMFDVIQKCQNITEKEAAECDLYKRSQKLGFHWSADLYPQTILLNEHVHDSKYLETTLHGWPLPAEEIIIKQKIHNDSELALIDTWLEIDKQTKEISIDKLPYSHWLPILQCRFANKTGIYMNQANIHKQLLNARKAKKIQQRQKKSLS